MGLKGFRRLRGFGGLEFRGGLGDLGSFSSGLS